MSTVDATFGVNGLASLNLPGNQRFLHSCTDASNNVLATGFTDICGNNNWNTLIARFKPTGVLDTTFNGTGYVVANIPYIMIAAWGGTQANISDYGTNIAVDNSGNIIVLGTLAYGRGENFVLRYLPNGTPDTSFANFSRIELQPTVGKWYLLGGNGILSFHCDFAYGEGEWNGAVGPWNEPISSLNPTRLKPWHNALLLTPDNGFYIYASPSFDSVGAWIYKFLSNGQLDPSYIDNNPLTDSWVTTNHLKFVKVPGIFILPLIQPQVWSITYDLSKNILVYGNNNNYYGVVFRITGAGVVDQTFGTALGGLFNQVNNYIKGISFFNIGNVSTITVDSLNRIITASHFVYGFIGLQRVLPNGTGDLSFASYGGGGTIYINVGIGSLDYVHSVITDSANNIYIIGHTNATYSDTTIISGNNVNYRFNTLNTSYTSAQIQNIMASRPNTGGLKMFVLCITPTGYLNKKFGNKGILLFNNATTDTSFNYLCTSAITDLCGNIVLSGFTDLNGTSGSRNDDGIFTRFNGPSIPVVSRTCFPAGTPVVTDQGIIPIDDIDELKHTIRGKKIVAVTSVVSDEDHLISIQKDALGKNIPSQKTLVTQNHRILHKGSMVKAKKLVDLVDNGLIKKADYSGDILYNILLEEQGKMVVNNMITETLDPENGIAKLYKKFKLSNLTESEKNLVIVELNKELASKAKTAKK
jgi:hypothetical protein